MRINKSIYKRYMTKNGYNSCIFYTERLFKVFAFLCLCIHIVVLYQNATNPVSVADIPVGELTYYNDESIYTYSYFKLKNSSNKTQDVYVNLYLLGSEGLDYLRYKCDVVFIEEWNYKKKNIKIYDDCKISIPPNTETGLYLKAILKNAKKEELKLQYPTEQEIEVVQY